MPLLDYVFGFIEPEREHRRQAANSCRDALEIFARVHTTTNEGFSLVGKLPGFSDRNQRTISAALFSRSFKSLHCAMDCAMRGYYEPAITLVRPVYENILLHWELLTNPASLAALYGNDEGWWKKRKFAEIARDIDRKLVASNQIPFVAEMWSDSYGRLSKFAHPRTQGIRIEFHSSKPKLLVAPEWDEQHCRMTMLMIVLAARLNLQQMMHFVNAAASSWHASAEEAHQTAVEWLEKQSGSEETD